jgi:ferrous iron transport protein A
MPDEKQTTLARMRAGQSGIVVQVQGGHGLVNRLGALGIIPGKRITKISSMLMRGPVTIEVDRTQVAIGFGMASKILVQLDDESTK